MRLSASAAVDGALAPVLNVLDVVVNERADIQGANVRDPCKESVGGPVFKHRLPLFFKHPADYPHVVKVHFPAGLLIDTGEKKRITIVVNETEGNIEGHLYML